MISFNVILSSSLAIVFILLLRRIFWKKMNPNVRYLLWIFVAVRIMLPLDFTIAIADDTLVAEVIHNSEETREKIMESVIRPVAEQTPRNIVAIDPAVAGEIKEVLIQTELVENNYKHFEISEFVGYVWIVGSVILAGYWVALNLYTFLKIKKRRIVGLESPIGVYEVDGVNGLVGVINPKIFVSTQIFADENRKKYVLAHELQHYRVGDHIWQLIRCICVIMQWFNPLVWIAYFKSQEDCELACDYRVLKELEEEEHASYAETLLYVIKLSRVPNRVLVTAMCDAKRSMVKRLEGIMTMQKKEPLIGILVLVSVVVMVAGSFTTYAVEKEYVANEKYKVFERTEQTLEEMYTKEYIYDTGVVSEETNELEENVTDLHVFELADMEVIPLVKEYTFSEAYEIGTVQEIDGTLPGADKEIWYAIIIDGIEYYYAQFGFGENVEPSLYGYAIISDIYSLGNGIQVGLSKEDILEKYPNMAVMDFEGNYLEGEHILSLGWNSSCYPGGDIVTNIEGYYEIESYLWEEQFDYVMVADVNHGMNDTLPVYIGLLMKDDVIAAITFYNPTAG